MVDISGIDSLVNRYVDCWRKYRPQYTGLYEDNDFGCETLQVFRNGYKIEAKANTFCILNCAKFQFANCGNLFLALNLDIPHSRGNTLVSSKVSYH